MIAYDIVITLDPRLRIGEIRLVFLVFLVILHFAIVFYVDDVVSLDFIFSLSYNKKS